MQCVILLLIVTINWQINGSFLENNGNWHGIFIYFTQKNSLLSFRISLDVLTDQMSLVKTFIKQNSFKNSISKIFNALVGSYMY